MKNGITYNHHTHESSLTHTNNKYQNLKEKNKRENEIEEQHVNNNNDIIDPPKTQQIHIYY